VDRDNCRSEAGHLSGAAWVVLLGGQESRRGTKKKGISAVGLGASFEEGGQRVDADGDKAKAPKQPPPHLWKQICADADKPRTLVGSLGVLLGASFWNGVRRVGVIWKRETANSATWKAGLHEPPGWRGRSDAGQGVLAQQTPEVNR